MPFREISAMEQRVAMLREYDTGVFSVSDLCERYRISRETFYQWKRRRDAGLEDWFRPRSTAPGHCPHETDPEVVAAIEAMRRRFPRFGPKKIKARLLKGDPSVAWPSLSTMGNILRRAGLTENRAGRRARRVQEEIVAGGTAANEEWSIDFKGWFRTLDGRRIDPLTVMDTASRYMLSVRIVPPDYDGVRGELERLFAETGLPGAIRGDNGGPFGSPGAGGLSRLSAWLSRLGIEVRFIPPGSPQDNGRHERMHRELKAETAREPSANAAAQQVRFDAFRVHYNEERPHEALDQTPPSQHWSAPARRMPAVVPLPWYDADHEVREIHGHGDIRWRGRSIFISEALSGEQIGLREREEGGHLVKFCDRELGVIAPDLSFIRFAPPRAKLRPAKGT
jgi:transposase InsO family protein